MGLRWRECEDLRRNEEKEDFVGIITDSGNGKIYA